MSAAVPPPGDARGANHLGNGFQQTGFVEPVAHLKENGVAAQSSPQSSPLVNKPAPVTPRSNGLSNSVPSLVSGTTAQSDDLTPATPTAAGPPTVLKPKDAEKVPVVAREAVVEADKRAAPQPQLDEKKDAELRQVKGEEAEGTIVEGIEDDALWVMLRSFNNQVNHVLHPATHTPANQPDLRQTNLSNVPYRSDTLKSNMERLITGIAPPSARGIQEIARLTDWHNEFHRTAYYCTAYFLSWVLGYTVVACTMFWIVLICFPSTRRFLFPYRPPPVEDPPLMVTETVTAGANQANARVPAAGTKLTRAEQAEEHSVEVTAVMVGYATTLLFGSKAEEGNAVVGPKEVVVDWDDPDLVVTDKEGKLLGYKTTRADPQAIMLDVDGELTPVRKDKVAQKTAKTDVERRRDELVTWMAKTTESSIGVSADFIEIMQKALSPPTVYPDQYARFKLAALLIVPALALHYIPARYFCRGITFLFGVVFWGHEWLNEGLRELLRRFPQWKEYVDPRNSILSGVPTDAQLTLHLLRVSEEEGDPIPPPPVAPNLEETKRAIREAQDPQALDAPKNPEVEDATKPQRVRTAAKKTKSKTKGAFKKIARKLAGMGSDVAVVGEERKLRGKIDGLVLKAKWGDDVPVGGYSAKLSGTNGHLFLDEDDECLSWVPLLSKKPEKIWYIDDLVEMKKDGLGVSRLALAAMSGAEIASLGLSLRFAKTADSVSLESMTEDQQLVAAQMAKETLVFKGVDAREELFNRLIAIGNQRWEML